MSSFNKFPKEKDCADYLLQFNRDVKAWRVDTAKKLKEEMNIGCHCPKCELARQLLEALEQ